MFTMHYVLGCWYWLLKLTDTFVWLYSNKNNSKKPGGDIPWCSPSFLLCPWSDELDGFSWACVWRSCPPEWWWTGKITDIDVTWGSGITVFFFGCFFTASEVRENTRYPFFQTLYPPSCHPRAQLSFRGRESRALVCVDCGRLKAKKKKQRASHQIELVILMSLRRRVSSPAFMSCASSLAV